MYCSPELLKVIKTKNFQNINKINHHKNDTYCLGLCLLEMGLMQSVHQVITDQKDFDENLLKQYKSQFQRKYQDNAILISIINSCLETIPEKRLSMQG